MFEEAHSVSPSDPMAIHWMEQERHYIYHIPEISKVGATEDLEQRVTEDQGWQAGEYDVVAVCNNLKYASDVEKGLQKLYGYHEDRSDYQTIKTKNMLKNYAKSATVTQDGLLLTERKKTGNIGVNLNFFAIEQLAKACAEGVSFKTWSGEIIKFASDEIDDLMPLADESQYRMKGSAADYFFRVRKLKNLRDKLDTELGNAEMQSAHDLWKETPIDLAKKLTKTPTERTDTITKIAVWAEGLGITKNTIQKQTLKLGEEFGELSHAVLKDDDLEIRDAIGDMVVVLTSLAIINGTTLQQCVNDTWKEIQSRVPIKDAEGNVVATTHVGGRKKNTEA